MKKYINVCNNFVSCVLFSIVHWAADLVLIRVVTQSVQVNNNDPRLTYREGEKQIARIVQKRRLKVKVGRRLDVAYETTMATYCAWVVRIQHWRKYKERAAAK